MDDVYFSDWLQSEINGREWSPAELARRAGVTRQAIGNYLAGKVIKPDETVLSDIARALGYPPDVVFRAAGLLPPKPPESEKRDLLDHLFDMLPEEKQDDILDYVRMKQEQWIREKRGQTGVKPVTGELK